MLPELEHEIELASRAVLASEDWSPNYRHAPDQHADLITQTASLEVAIMRYFRQLAKQTDELVNWWYYKAQSVQAYNVQVMVNETAIVTSDKEFIKVIFDPLAKIQGTGAEAADVQYGESIELTPTSTVIQQLTTDQVGALVGKTRDDSGILIDNERVDTVTGKAFKIDDTTRDLINNAIKKSLNLGYSQQEAANEVKQYIANPVRATMIARTEAVRAYNIGQHAYATQAGYQGKYWTTAGATDICADNEAQGVIAISDSFVSGAMYAPGHLNCRCATAYTPTFS